MIGGQIARPRHSRVLCGTLVRPADVFAEPFANGLGLEAPRPLTACERDATGLIDDEQSLRPRGIRVIHAVVHLIGHAGHGESERRRAGVRDLLPFPNRLRLREDNVVLSVRVELPFIVGVRLTNVYEHEGNPILVGLV